MSLQLRQRAKFLPRRVIFWCRFRYALKRDQEIRNIALRVGEKFLLGEPSLDVVQSSIIPKPGYARELPSSICWEAPIVVVLQKNAQPCFGIGLELTRNCIHIRQLQGERGLHLHEAFRDWPRRCVEAVLTYAKEAPHIDQVRLYRAHTDLFYDEPYVAGGGPPDPKTIATIRKRMRRRYDGTARQLGFTMRKDWGEFDTRTH